MALRYLSIIYFFLSCLSAYSQEGSGYLIQQYTTDNGMPSNGIKGMQWDERSGFLWVATEAGIARFNGIEFNNFTKENCPALLHERMAYLVKKNNGDILGSDVGNNLISIRSNNPAAVSMPELNNVIGFKRSLYLSTQGEIIKKRVLSFINANNDIAWNDIYQLTDTSVIIIDGKKTYHYLTASGEKKTFQVPFKTKNGFVQEGRFFLLGDDNKIYRLHADGAIDSEIKWFSGSNEKISFAAANQLLYWENGMQYPIFFEGNRSWLLRYRNNSMEAVLICSDIPTLSFIRFAQYSEKYNVLFIGTDSKGIIVIRKNRMTMMKNRNSDIRERNAYYSQVELGNGNVLTNEGHIIGNNPGSRQLVPIKGKFDYSVYLTGDSVLWFAQVRPETGKNILHAYHYASGQTTAYPKIQIQSNFALHVANNRIYLASSFGLGYISGDSLLRLFPLPAPPKTMAAPYTMLEFSPGVLGVGSCDGLVLYHLATGKTDTLISSGGYCFRSLWKFRDYVFTGSYGKGFYIWKNGKLKKMPVDKNKFLLYAHCFVPDPYGFCWISTNRGLFKVKIDDLIDAYENNKQQVYYHYYGRNDGMDITEMNGGCAPCALRLSTGLFSFPTMDGLLWVNPQTDNPVLPTGDIFIDDFISGQQKLNTDSLDFHQIPFSQRDLVLRLGFSSWCNRENIYLEYRLNDWPAWIPVDMSSGATIRLQNLEPGNYRLQIRKTNGFGLNNYSYTNINFAIQTPWNKSWWFYIGCAILLLGAITLFLRFRTRQYQIQQKKLEKQVDEKTRALQDQNLVLEKNNSIKTKLISIISHDIVTPLKFLTAAGKNLLEKRKLMPEELQQETIGEMTNTSQELQLLSTNILNWIKYQNENRRMMKETFNIHEMVNQVLGILQSLAKQKNLIISNETDPALAINQYYEPLKILLYNLLTNSIRFTEKGIIHVKAVYESSYVILSVKDEGIGMTPEQVQRLMGEEVVITSANVDHKRGHGLGFLIIKDLVKTMGATLHIESKKEAGTTVFVKIPGKPGTVS